MRKQTSKTRPIGDGVYRFSTDSGSVVEWYKKDSDGWHRSSEDPGKGYVSWTKCSHPPACVGEWSWWE